MLSSVYIECISNMLNNNNNQQGGTTNLVRCSWWKGSWYLLCENIEQSVPSASALALQRCNRYACFRQPPPLPKYRPSVHLGPSPNTPTLTCKTCSSDPPRCSEWCQTTTLQTLPAHCGEVTQWGYTIRLHMRLHNEVRSGEVIVSCRLNLTFRKQEQTVIPCKAHTCFQ